MPVIKKHQKYNFLEISPDGCIKNTNTNHVKKQTIDSGTGYYVISLYEKGKNNKKYVHRLIAETFLPNPLCLNYVDHKDGNKLNNNLDNLRWCTQSQNLTNARKRKGTTSKYKGIYWHKKNKTWVIRIKTADKKVIFAYCKNEKDAAKKYNELALMYYGEFSLLNIVN